MAGWSAFLDDRIDNLILSLHRTACCTGAGRKDQDRLTKARACYQGNNALTLSLGELPLSVQKQTEVALRPDSLALRKIHELISCGQV
jgi:hypothetical protein